MSKINVLLLGSGTGGHFYPLVAVADALKEQAVAAKIELDVRYFGDPGDYADYLAQHSIRISRIASSKLRRYASILNFLDFFKFFWGFFVAMFKLYFFMPEVVFSKSGPGVLPIIFAARWYRIPIVIHESDSVPGLTNKISARRAEIVEVAFESAKRYFVKAKKINLVGLPVRSSLINTKSIAACRAVFGLPDEKPVLFILGGSQGAQSLNEFVISNVELLLNHFEIIHQVGRENFDQYSKEFAFVTKHFNPDLLARYRSLAFLSDEQMSAALGAASVVLSRAGSSIFEIAANSKPSVLVPLTSAANNHQFENAYSFARAGAAIVIEEPNLLPGLLLTQLDKIMDNPDFAAKMSNAAKAFYRPNAASDIARDVLAVAGVIR